MKDFASGLVFNKDKKQLGNNLINNIYISNNIKPGDYKNPKPQQLL